MTFPNDMSRIARGVGNLETSATDYANAAGAQAPARSLIRKTYHVDNVAAVLANNDDPVVANSAGGVFFKQPVNVLGVTIQPRGALTGNTANYTTFALKAVGSTGVIGNTIATRHTGIVASGGTGNLNPGAMFTLTVDSANARIAANSWVAPSVVANGKAAGATTWAIDVEEEGPDLYAV
jgi:hypothetical protein